MEKGTMDQIKDKLGSLAEGELLLDVRSAAEYADGHIEGSKNIDHEEVGGRAEELKSFSKIYVYCRSGRRADIACQALEQAGVTQTICVDDGGMMEWGEKGYPVVK